MRPSVRENPASEVKAIIAALDLPAPKRIAFTAEAKEALLEAIHMHQWQTAREAYGWVWNHLGVHVSYLTVWRFLSSKGLLNCGEKFHRRLSPQQ